MSKSEELRAQLAVAELEEELAAAKATDPDPSELRDLKQRVRQSRENYRSRYRIPSAAADDGTAEPAAVETSAGVKGGK
jgi:hypothetical protein